MLTRPVKAKSGPKTSASHIQQLNIKDAVILLTSSKINVLSFIYLTEYTVV